MLVLACGVAWGIDPIVQRRSEPCFVLFVCFLYVFTVYLHYHSYESPLNAPIDCFDLYSMLPGLTDKRALNKAIAQHKAESLQEKLQELSKQSPMLNTIRIHGVNVLDLLFDYNSMESMNLLFCALVLNIGIMFEGLRHLETNHNGFSFFGVDIQESSTFTMNKEWNLYFTQYLESCSWFMFVFFITVCLLSIFIDLIRNCLYHTYGLFFFSTMLNTLFTFFSAFLMLFQCFFNECFLYTMID